MSVNVTDGILLGLVTSLPDLDTEEVASQIANLIQPKHESAKWDFTKLRPRSQTGSN